MFVQASKTNNCLYECQARTGSNIYTVLGQRYILLSSHSCIGISEKRNTEMLFYALCTAVALSVTEFALLEELAGV